MNPQQLFIIGTGRCGSSLVHRLLAHHPQYAFISNIDDRLSWLNLKGRYNRKLLNSSYSFINERFSPSEGYRLILQQIHKEYAFSQQDLTPNEVTPDTANKYQIFVTERLQAQNATHYLHKYTGWSRIAFFHHIFPQAKFVHIVRDGRDVALSWLNQPWWPGHKALKNWYWGNLTTDEMKLWHNNENADLVLSAIGWKHLIESIIQGQKQIPSEQFMTLRYEDLIQQPERQLQSIVEFNELDMHPDIQHALENTHIHRQSLGQFHKKLDSTTQSMLTELLYSQLAYYNYTDN